MNYAFGLLLTNLSQECLFDSLHDKNAIQRHLNHHHQPHTKQLDVENSELLI